MVYSSSNIGLNQFCCVDKKIRALEQIESIKQLINDTASCFKNIKLTFKEHGQIIVHFYQNDTFPFSEKDCNIKGPCEESTTTSNIVYIAVWVVMLLLIVTSNLTVITAVQRISYLKQNITNLFISSLAISDLLVGIFMIPIRIKYTYNNLRFCPGLWVCRLYLTSDNIFFTASITNLFVIAIDRYIALNYPYKYPIWITPHRAKTFIIFIWVYGIIFGMLVNLKWDNISKPSIHITNMQCLSNENHIYVIFVYFLVFFIPVFIMGILYYRILVIARYHARSISSSIYYYNNNNESRRSSSLSSASLSNESDKYETSSKTFELDKGLIRRSSKSLQLVHYRRMVFKASKSVATVYGTFVMCWLPVSGLSLALAVCRDCFKESDLKWFYIIFVEFLPIFNSMMNPVIYVLMNKQYRTAFKTIFGKFFKSLIPRKRKVNGTTSQTATIS